MQKVTLEELLDENSMIMDYPVEQARFKELHKEICELVIDPLIVRKPPFEEPLGLEPEYELVLKAKKLVESYKELGYSMPGSDLKVEQACLALDAYADNLPVMAKFSYNRMKKAAKNMETSWRNRITARSSAKDYLLCIDLGNRLNTKTGKFQKRRSETVRGMIAKAESIEKNTIESARQDIDRYSAQFQSILERCSCLNEEVGSYGISAGRIGKFHDLYSSFRNILKPQLGDDPIIGELAVDARKTEEQAARQLDLYLKDLITAVDQQYELARDDPGVNLETVYQLYEKINMIKTIDRKMEEVDALLRERKAQAQEDAAKDHRYQNMPIIAPGEKHFVFSDYMRSCPEPGSYALLHIKDILEGSTGIRSKLERLDQSAGTLATMNPLSDEDDKRFLKFLYNGIIEDLERGTLQKQVGLSTQRGRAVDDALDIYRSYLAS